MAKARVECRDACDILCRHVSAFGPANVIAGYMPIQSEIDPLPAMKTLYDQGHTICVPIIQGKGKALLFREWNPDAPLIEGDFGALIPRSGQFLKPTILIAPLVAYDARGYRLGYGGGYYDRFFARSNNVNKVAVLYPFQLIEKVPIEKHDIKMNRLVTSQLSLKSSI